MKKFAQPSFLLLLVLSLACLESCANKPTAPSVIPMAFENVLWEGLFKVNRVGTFVVRDSATWMAFADTTWRVYDGLAHRVPPPAVDFGRKMVLGVSYGVVWDGWDNPVDVIRHVRMLSGRIEVDLDSARVHCGGAAVVYPLQMVEIERSDLPVVFLGPLPQPGCPDCCK